MPETLRVYPGHHPENASPLDYSTWVLASDCRGDTVCKIGENGQHDTIYHLSQADIMIASVDGRVLRVEVFDDNDPLSLDKKILHAVLGAQRHIRAKLLESGK